MPTMKCPVCRATYRSSSVVNSQLNSQPHSLSNSLNCHRCGIDLSPLIRIHDQSIGYHRRAIQALQEKNYSVAADWNHQALGLSNNNADFHALAGQLLALQGKFQEAIGAWEKAVKLNAQHPTARLYLQECKLLTETIGEPSC
jgi:tetratricopeptide (TPR) repeat protein